MSGAVENAGYFARLGFDIDTSGLAHGRSASDAFTTSLDRLATSADRAATATGKPSASLRRAGDEAMASAGKIRSLTDTLRNASQQADGATGHIRSLSDAFGSFASGGLDGVNRGLSSSLGLLGRLPSALGPAGMAMAIGATGAVTLASAYMSVVSATAKVQDQYAILEGRLKNIYGSQEMAKAQMVEIIALANKNGAAIDQTAESYLRLARNNESIGLTRKQMVQLTDEVQMLGRISGATAGEFSAGIMQFSQALSSGRLGGDELRSLTENYPALVKAIADGMGVTVGQLRAMGAAGELTGDKITNALLKQLPKIQSEFESLPQTTEQAFTRVSNSWDMLLKHMGEQLNSSGVMQGLADKTRSVIDYLDSQVRPATTGDLRSQSMLDYSMSKAAERNWSISFGRKANYADVAAYNKGMGYEALSMVYAGQASDAATVKSYGVRAQGVIQQLDQQAKKVADLKAQLKTLEEAYQHMGSFDPDMAKSLEKLRGYIASVKKQIEDTLPALTKYRQNTSERIADFVRYGANGGTDFGADVRKLMDQSLAQGTPIDRMTAENAVMADRVQNIREQTEAMREQISQQRDLTSVIGQGVEAQIELQVQQKAATLQAELLGKMTGKELVAAVESYKGALRELLQAQQMVADGQAEFAATQEMEIQRQLSAAQAAGANTGALRELEAQLRRLQEMGQATPEGARAIALKGQAQDEARARAERQKLADMLRDIEDRKTALNAASLADSRSINQEAQARKFAADFSPDQQASAYAAKLLELHTQDAETIKRGIDDKQRAVELQQQEIAAAKTGGLAGQIMLAKAKELNEIRASGLKLTEQEIALRLRLAEISAIQDQQLQNAQKQADAYLNIWTTTAQSIGGAVDDAFQKVLDGQEVKLSDLLKRIISQIGSAIINATITQPLINIFTQMAGNLRAGAGLESMRSPSMGGFLSGLFGSGTTAAMAGMPRGTAMAMGAANANGLGATAALSPVVPRIDVPQLSVDRMLRTSAGSFGTIGSYNATYSAKFVDPRLTDILKTTTNRYGYQVDAFSGFRPGDPRFHGKGWATDIRLYDASGQPLDSPGRGPGHMGHYQSAQYFRQYEDFAQHARIVQMEKYPELAQRFRWGGYFSSKRGMRGYGALDGMHFDLGGHRLGMAAGSWEGGLTDAARRAYPGIQSVGMSQKVVDQITSQWQTKMNAANQNIATNMPKVFDNPMKSIATNLAKNIDVGPIQKLTPAISNVTQASSTAIPALGGFGNSIVGLLQQLIPSFFGSIFGSAHGSAYDGGVRFYGSGGVVTRPMSFRTNSGIGVAGEAGAEAIMPLKRGPDGRLGVASNGGGGGGDVSVVINDMRSSSSAQPVETEHRKGPDGRRMIAVTIKDEVRSQIKGGKFDDAMAHSFGINRRLAGR